ncbi:peptidylprolyl isomerase [Panacibacter sp. DH6]|uniref:Peptidyl-prolyl cis-trans isomerase n=2 Tax=Panacibacter microcysteis TaxID=2793269 RepID=A0A931E7U6_9BACT|nr:peptidylprolyl isomerase [Panacibacter microcysteis]
MRVMKKLLYVCWVLFIVACSEQRTANPHVIIDTKFGGIEIELYPEQAPKTVAAFLGYVDSGFYKRANFYRVLNDENQPSNAPKAELIQGGIWKTNYQKAIAVRGVPHEPTSQTKLLHKNGIISLARAEPGTAGTEFFICIGDQPGFDYGGDNNPDGQGYAPFGKVVKGMDAVLNIYKSKEYDQKLDPPIVIYNISRR